MNPIFPLEKKKLTIAWLVITVLMAWLIAGTCFAATETVLDTFSEKSYSNQDGTAEWSSDWLEYNDDKDPESGNLAINQGTLSFNGSNQYNSIYIIRSVDLSQATSAVLTFDFETKNLWQWWDIGEVAVYISSNGGSSWTWLTAINSSDAQTGSWSADISSYMAANTKISFYQTEPLESKEDISIDNVQIAYQVPDPVQLVAHYALEGDVADSSGNGHTGSSQGTVTYQRAKVCDGVQLDGNGYLQVPDNDDLDFTGSFTVMTWIHPDSLSVSGHEDLYSFLSKDTNYEVHVRSNGSLYWWWDGGNFTTSPGVITPGEWSHVAFVYSQQAGIMQILVNGSVVKTYGYSANLVPNTEPLYIGTDKGTDGGDWTKRRFYGSIDEVRLYTGALSVGEISDLMNETDPCAVPTPLAEWRFDECGYVGVGALAEDAQGSYDATAQGAVASIDPEDSKIGRAAELAEDDSYFELSGGDIPMPQSWTVSTWFKWPMLNTSGNRYHVVGSMANGGGDILWLDRGANYRWGTWVNPNFIRGSYSFSTLTSGWHHLVAVGKDGWTYLYVDGDYKERIHLQAKGDFHYIGISDDFWYANEGFRTDLDEYLVFSGELTESQIRSLYQLQSEGRNLDGTLREDIMCGAGIDHFEIIHDGSALTCVPEEVRVQACADAATPCTPYTEDVEITLSPTGWLAGDTKILSGGSGTFRLRHTTAGIVKLSVSSNPAAEDGYECVRGEDGSSCDLEFFRAGFLYDLPDLESCSNSSKVDILAVQMDDKTQTCIGDDNFADKDRPVSFTASYIGTKIGDDSVFIKGNKGDSELVKLDEAKSIMIYFNEAAKGEFIFKYDDAGEVTLSASCDVSYEDEDEDMVLEMRGADSFVAYPHHLQVGATYTYTNPDTDTDVTRFLNNTGSSGDPHWPAGEAFDLTVSGVCKEGSETRSFKWQTALSVDAYKPTAGKQGSFSPSTLDADLYDKGVANTTVSYSEVGTVTLQATAKNYRGSNHNVTGSADIGRFTPAKFGLLLYQTPELAPACVTTNSEGDITGGFTYVGEPFYYAAAPIVKLTAYNASGDVTKNYTQEGWWKITKEKLTSERSYSMLKRDLKLSGGGVSYSYPLDKDNQGSGLLTYDASSEMKFTRGTKIAPFRASIDLKVNVVDADGISASKELKIEDISFSGENETKGVNTDEMRWGRMVMQNAYGSELAPLAMPLRAEYYNGSSFVTNSADDCTSLSTTELILTGTVTSKATLHKSSSSSLVAGDAGLVFSAPGATGYIDVELNLSDMPWLQFDWDGDKNHNNNPAARASFGLFEGHPAMIYMRENF